LRFYLRGVMERDKEADGLSILIWDSTLQRMAKAWYAERIQKPFNSHLRFYWAGSLLHIHLPRDLRHLSILIWDSTTVSFSWFLGRHTIPFNSHLRFYGRKIPWYYTLMISRLSILIWDSTMSI
jgi:hypothetical protein